MDARSEAIFEKKAERMLRGQRELQSGRDYRAFYERYRTDVNNDDFDRNFDEVYPDAPGSKAWFDRKFGKR
uniref:Uncharacterized protein n=1 Tax=viral metagenome TaxID=1070528 RepID=A0A6M3IGP5_9ZZZZ